MCGFVGGSNPEWNYVGALASIEHRGPDAGGLHQDGLVHVGFRRLSIIDLDEHANQPMFEGDTWLVFNGEIYGYVSLRRELESAGRRFRTQSDTEVVLQAYLEWGEKFIDRIDGMFAIAIWDSRQQKLKLFRDRPGIKPLYYYFDGQNFAFASELKAIETAVGVSSLVTDKTALYDFLGYRYVPTPKTLYRDCFKLPPAHSITFDPCAGRLSEPSRFWSVPDADESSTLTIENAVEELRHLIKTAVHDQMIADVPLGFFLSGGVDSSVVVASAADGDSQISTFSIGFDSDEVSETPYARQVAQLFSTDHHERILSASDSQSLLSNLQRWFDEPFADESAMPTFLVSAAAREEVTVVLTGDGADEVFGGYRTYPRFARYEKFPDWPGWAERGASSLRRRFDPAGSAARAIGIAELALSGGPELWGRIMGGMPHPDKAAYREMFGIPDDYDDWWQYRRFWRDDLPVRTRLQLVDFHTFLPDLVLTKVDRTSMAVSLEARVPMLDRRIIEFSFSLPERIRFHGDELKGLLRHAYRGVLPDSILDRRKKGFGIPRYYLRELRGRRPIQEHILRSLFLADAA